MSAAQAAAANAAVSAPCILLVDDEPGMIELLEHALAGRVDARFLHAASVREAASLMELHTIDLLVADLHLPDGNGMDLLELRGELCPSSEALVITGAPSIETAVDAMRLGAADFLAKPFDAPALAERIEQALARQSRRLKQENRLRRLKHAVRRLNAARKTVNQKVDLLCNDLVSAYAELSRQVDGVRIQQSFRAAIDSSRDLEQLLCHTMDWLLRQVGYANIGMWLMTPGQELQLGAFMKYTTTADPAFSDALAANLLRVATRRGFVRVGDTKDTTRLTPAERTYLAGQDTIAISCTYLGETLGVLVLFRDQKTPFTADDVAALKAVIPMLGAALADAVNAQVGERSDEPSDGLPDLPGPADPPTGKGKPDPADWWKRGEAPPF